MLVYRVHANNLSRATPIAYLLPDFVRYTARAMAVYVRAPYSLWQKLQLICLVALKHGRYHDFLNLVAWANMAS